MPRFLRLLTFVLALAPIACAQRLAYMPPWSRELPAECRALRAPPSWARRTDAELEELRAEVAAAVAVFSRDRTEAEEGDALDVLRKACPDSPEACDALRDHLIEPTPRALGFEYTQAAMARSAEGTMRTRCAISREGKVRGCEVLVGMPYGMVGMMTSKLAKVRMPADTWDGKPIARIWVYTLRMKIPQVDRTEAMAEARARVQAYPEDAGAWLNLAEQYTFKGVSYPAADTIRVLRDATRFVSEPWIADRLAQELEKQNELEEANRWALEALSKFSWNPSFARTYARISARRAQCPEALEAQGFAIERLESPCGEQDAAEAATARRELAGNRGPLQAPRSAGGRIRALSNRALNGRSASTARP